MYRRHHQHRPSLGAILHQLDRRGEADRGLALHGQGQGLASHGLRVQVEPQRRHIPRAGHDMGHRHVERPLASGHQLAFVIPLGDPETRLAEAQGHVVLEAAALGRADVPAEAQRGDVRVVLQGRQGVAGKMFRRQPRVDLDEAAQGLQRLPMAQQAVGDMPLDGQGVRLQAVELTLLFPAAGEIDGHAHAEQGEHHGDPDLAKARGPQGRVAQQQGQAQGGEGEDAEGVTDEPVPPGEQDGRRRQHLEDIQAADSDGGGHQTGQRPPHEQEDDHVALLFQPPPAVRLEHVDQAAACPGLQGCTSGDQDRRGQRCLGDGAVEQSQQAVHACGSRPDPGQRPPAHHQSHRQGHARGGEDRAGVSGGNSENQP